MTEKFLSKEFIDFLKSEGFIVYDWLNNGMATYKVNYDNIDIYFDKYIDDTNNYFYMECYINFEEFDKDNICWISSQEVEKYFKTCWIFNVKFKSSQEVEKYFKNHLESIKKINIVSLELIKICKNDF